MSGSGLRSVVALEHAFHILKDGLSVSTEIRA